MARDRAFTNRRAVAEGRDPLAEKRKARVPTFREAATKTYEANRPRWRSEKTAANWIQQLERHAFAVVGDIPVNQIGREHVLRILAPIWTVHPEIARKLRSRIRAILGWAQAHGYVEHNVAGEAVAAALPAMPAVAAHYRALPYRDVGAALDVIATSRASLSARACLRFVVLTACRSGETRLATWSEIDLEAGEWRVPAARMKTGAEHRVPLSDAALEVLESVRPLRDRSELLFPSPSRPGNPLSDMTLTKVLRDTGLAGPRDRPRLPHLVPDVGQRANERAARRRRNGARARGRFRRGAELCAVRLVREAPGADGDVGGVRDRCRREGGAHSWLR